MAKKTEKTTVEATKDSQGNTTVKVEKTEEKKAEKHTEEGTEEAENQPEKELSPMEKLEADLAEAQIGKADMQDKFLRLMAEFENFKKRTAREKRELRETAAQDLIVDLLTVIDDFDRAFKAQEDAGKADEDEGMRLIVGKFKSTLENKGLTAMDAMGKDFDPDWHEAITEIPAPSDEQKGKVVDVITKGYLLGEKIIRYAKVVVGK